MPNRIIKESICRSDQVNALSDFAEVVFYRLIVCADDYGCFDGRARIIKNTLFPLRDGLTDDSVMAAVLELEQQGLLAFYEANDGKQYIRLTGWSNHQRIRNSRHKYPDPDECRQVAASCGELRPESNPIQSNPNPNPNPTRACARGDAPPTVEEVDAYCRENGLKIDAQVFVDYNASKGWMIGNSPMRDWRAACRNWVRRERAAPSQQRPAKTVREQQYTQREYEDSQELPEWMQERRKEMNCSSQ